MSWETFKWIKIFEIPITVTRLDICEKLRYHDLSQIHYPLVKIQIVWVHAKWMATFIWLFLPPCLRTNYPNIVKPRQKAQERTSQRENLGNSISTEILLLFWFFIQFNCQITNWWCFQSNKNKSYNTLLFLNNRCYFQESEIKLISYLTQSSFLYSSCISLNSLRFYFSGSKASNSGSSSVFNPLLIFCLDCLRFEFLKDSTDINGFDFVFLENVEVIEWSWDLRVRIAECWVTLTSLR